MGISSAFLFSLLIGFVICENSNDDYIQDPLVPVTIFITNDQYRACKEVGYCTFTPQSVTLNEPEDIDGKLEGNSYFELCRKIHSKMEKLEAEYPDVKRLKLKWIQMFNSYSSEFEFESEKGELVVVKILGILKNMIERLRVEFEDKWHKVDKPEPFPIVDPVPIEEEITAEPEPEPGHPILVGSHRGIPGIHFPNYSEIPITSFTCSDKTLIPGFYADLETGCQVFHLCYEHRMESFLCPIGTIFNQPILACDYWYSADCSQASDYYEEPNIPEKEYIPKLIDENIVEKPEKISVPKTADMKDFLRFLPVKAKVTEMPKFDKTLKTQILKPSVTLQDTEAIADKIFGGVLSLGSHVTSKASEFLRQMPEPKYKDSIMIDQKSFHSAAAIPIVKAKVASAAAVPIVKAKVASKAIPYFKMAALKPKIALAPLKLKSAAVLPMIKTKVAAAAVSPLTKKALALGYLKLLKVKKLALMG